MKGCSLMYESCASFLISSLKGATRIENPFTNVL